MLGHRIRNELPLVGVCGPAAIGVRFADGERRVLVESGRSALLDDRFRHARIVKRHAIESEIGVRDTRALSLIKFYAGRSLTMTSAEDRLGERPENRQGYGGIRLGTSAVIPVWSVALTLGAGLPDSSSEVPPRATTVCISTRLDPLSYRPNPSLATRSPDFLSRIESQVSRGFVDAVGYALKARTGSPSTSEFFWQSFSALDIEKMGYPPQCSEQAINVYIISSFDSVRKVWSIVTDIKSRDRLKVYSFSGKDSYAPCAEMCQTDPLGGMGKALIDHGSLFLDELEDDRRGH